MNYQGELVGGYLVNIQAEELIKFPTTIKIKRTEQNKARQF